MSGEVAAMPTDNPLFWESLTFSTAAAAIVTASIWWFYLSPLRARPAAAARPSPRLAGWLAALLGLSAVEFVAGALWDASRHILTGQVPAGADFLWPPHLLIYGSFLISLIIAIIAVAIVAWPGWRAGERDPRLWIRRNPYLGLVALASLYSLLSIPGDALWHALYGIDLTAWSPPHLIIGFMMSAVTVCAVGVLVQARAAQAGWSAVDLAVPVLLGFMLNVAGIVGYIEWEIWGGAYPSLVRTNPIWVYPLVCGALACATLALARRLSRFPFAATLATLAYFGLRLGVMFGLSLSGNIVPSVPPLFVLGAVLLDVIPWQRFQSGLLRDAAMAAAFTIGYLALALPLLAVREHLPPFTAADDAAAVVATLIVTIVLMPLVRLAGAYFLGESKSTPVSRPSSAKPI
jgi:hypothetical protein